MDNTIAKSRWYRLIPVAFITYSLAYLDRANFGFGTAGGMAEDLKITPEVSSLLGSLFFLGYFFFQIPGALYAANKSAKRCQRAGIDLIIWGSGGARRIPEGYDATKAREQFISIARKVADVAKEYRIRLALENLNSTETNFINTAADALQVVKDVNHPNFRLCVDIYHMLMENEPPAIIESTREYLIHCDIAERDGRTAPGVHGQDFIPYLRALSKVKYRKLIVLECRWNNVEAEVKQGRAEVLRQLKIAYSTP